MKSKIPLVVYRLLGKQVEYFLLSVHLSSCVCKAALCCQKYYDLFKCSPRVLPNIYIWLCSTLKGMRNGHLFLNMLLVQCKVPMAAILFKKHIIFLSVNDDSSSRKYGKRAVPTLLLCQYVFKSLLKNSLALPVPDSP